MLSISAPVVILSLGFVPASAAAAVVSPTYGPEA